MAHNNEMISIKEACHIAQVSRQTMYEWRKANLFEWHAVTTRIVRINKESFISFLKRKGPVFLQAPGSVGTTKG
jgi:predicted site-specific integrase-resolvase